jgi:hypothetical protein
MKSFFKKIIKFIKKMINSENVNVQPIEVDILEEVGSSEVPRFHLEDFAGRCKELRNMEEKKCREEDEILHLAGDNLGRKINFPVTECLEHFAVIEKRNGDGFYKHLLFSSDAESTINLPSQEEIKVNARKLGIPLRLQEPAGVTHIQKKRVVKKFH